LDVGEAGGGGGKGEGDTGEGGAQVMLKGGAAEAIEMSKNIVLRSFLSSMYSSYRNFLSPEAAFCASQKR
jgi:hypothetical protein